jgi:hypothetical protein
MNSRLNDDLDAMLERVRRSRKMETESHTRVHDPVYRPRHYGLTLPDGLECEAFDVIHAVLGDEGTAKYCLGSTLKYLLRAGKKDGNPVEQDLRKAAWFLNRAAGIWEEMDRDRFPD